MTTPCVPEHIPLQVTDKHNSSSSCKGGWCLALAQIIWLKMLVDNRITSLVRNNGYESLVHRMVTCGIQWDPTKFSLRFLSTKKEKDFSIETNEN